MSSPLRDRPRYQSAGARYHCRNAGEHERQATSYVRGLIARGSTRVPPELARAVESGTLEERIEALRAFGADDACWPTAKAGAS